MWIKGSWGVRLSAVALSVGAAAGLVSDVSAHPVECTAAGYVTWRAENGRSRTLSTVDSNGQRRDIAELGHPVNAVGYSPDHGRLFGLIKPDLAQFLDIPPSLLAIDTDGRTRHLGPLRGPHAADDGIGGAYNGTWLDGRLTVLSDSHIVSIDTDTARVAKRVELEVPTDELDIGDITAVNATGTLWGLSTDDQALVAIDPYDGTVTRSRLDGLPETSMAGTVLADPDGRLLSVVNGIDGESVVYRVDPGAGVAHPVAGWPAITSADGASCDQPAAAPSPSPRPSPSIPDLPSLPPAGPPSSPSPAQPSPMPSPTPSSAPVASPPTTPTPRSPAPSASAPPSTAPRSPAPAPASTTPTPLAPPSHSAAGPEDPPPALPRPSPSQAQPPDPTAPRQTPSAATRTQTSPESPPARPRSPRVSDDAVARPGPAADVTPQAGAEELEDEKSDERRRWIAVGVVVFAMAGAAGVKASAKRRR